MSFLRALPDEEVDVGRMTLSFCFSTFRVSPVTIVFRRMGRARRDVLSRPAAGATIDGDDSDGRMELRIAYGGIW
jgi:hypothetical protein